MTGQIAGIASPPVRGGEAARLAALVARLEDTQWLAPEAIAAGQRRQRAALIAHHARHSGQFARRLAAAGLSAADAARDEGFAALGLLTRREIQTAPDFFAGALPEGHGPAAEVKTAGSTGEPVTSRRTMLNRLDWYALTMRDHAWQGRDLAGRYCAIRSHLPEPARLPDWGEPARLLHETGEALAIPIETGLAEQLDLIRAFRPTSLLVYPTNLRGLLDEAGAGGIPGLADIRTIGEPLSPDLRETAERLTGARVSDIYSMSEAGYIALMCPASRRYHVMAEMVQIEVLRADGTPCAPGETGRVIVTDLRNFAAPIIRYETGDMAEPGDPCACGRGLPTLDRIGGRVRNLLTYPDGRRVWPLLHYQGFREIAAVAQYQFVQHDRETIEVRLVLDAPFTPDREAALRAHIVRALRYPFRLRFTIERARIPLGGSGKYEEFLSLIDV